jgi:multiple sugar transport system substrate-binding protein
MTRNIRLGRAMKRSATAALILATTVGLVACGSPSAGPELDEELSGEVLMWSSFTQGPRAEYLERMADAFMSDNPDVTVKIETFSWPDFQTKWTTGLASGQVPDLSTALPTQVVQMVNVEALAPVDDVIDEIGRDRFAESALREGTEDGVSYSVPLYSHAHVMWYRTDLLEAAGLEVPKTWDEFRDAAIAMTDAPNVFGVSVPLGTNDFMATQFLTHYVRSAGESLISEDGRADVTSDAAIEGIEYWIDLYETVSPEGSINYNAVDQSTLFYQGKTALDFNSGFHIGGVQATAPDLLDDIAAAPLPKRNADDPDFGSITSNIPLVVWKASDNQAAAKAFMKTLYVDEDYIEFLHSVPGGMLPALTGIAENPDYLANPTLQQFTDSVAVIQGALPLGNAVGMEEGPVVQAGILSSQGVIEQMFQDIIINGTPVREAAKNAEDKLNQLFVGAGVTF